MAPWRASLRSELLSGFHQSRVLCGVVMSALGGEHGERGTKALDLHHSSGSSLVGSSTTEWHVAFLTIHLFIVFLS